ncbi:MAG TPA: hypothetical protein VGX50_10985 [Longimicrobium sp.]|nr:hypothetical protein [Longimicrobium sp.]
MIVAVPRKWFSGDYLLQQAHGTVADLDVSAWREQGEFDVAGGRYRVYREGMASGAFVLEKSGQTLARAVKPSAFKARFEIQAGGRAFTMHRPRWWRSDFALLEGQTQVGSVRRARAFTRRTIVDLPHDLPLAAQVFVFWLALIIWNREQSAAS